MKKVAFVSYYFPPIGGAAAQRPLQLVRHLREHGYQPIVITGSGHTRGRWAPSDPTLGEQVPDDIDLHRVPGPEPGESGGWASRSERWLGQKSPWSRWWVDGVVGTVATVAADVDLVYTVVSPYETVEACGLLARRLGVPWVADLGDPWALDDMAVYLTALHRRQALHRMQRGLASADGVIVSVTEAERRIEEHLPGLRPRVLVAIPNGYDAADFQGEPPPRIDDGILRVAHTGYLHTELGRGQHRASAVRRLLGGGQRDVDILTRSHVYLLEAVNRLLAREPELGRRIEVHLAGVTTGTDEEIAARCPAVRLHGYLPHRESVALLRGADLLFLPMQKLGGGRRAGNVPGKTYEYLASARPILAAVPPGDARDALARAGATFVCEPDDVDAMARILAERVRAKVGDAPEPVRDMGVVSEYEWGRLAVRVAETLDALT